jgi:hypothetical protein
MIEEAVGHAVGRRMADGWSCVHAHAEHVSSGSAQG